MYSKIKEYHSDIIEYFLEYIENSEYLLLKDFKKDIFSPRDINMANKLLSNLLKESNLKEWINRRSIFKYFKSTPCCLLLFKVERKGIFMLSESKELGTIERKKK